MYYFEWNIHFWIILLIKGHFKVKRSILKSIFENMIITNTIANKLYTFFSVIFSDSILVIQGHLQGQFQG